MGFQRRILHYGPGPDEFQGDLTDRAVEGCWFEVNRLGGCGSGEVVLKDRFVDRGDVEIGDWIALERTEGERWYFGRVEERTFESPAKVTYRLEGMGIELGEVFPGGFGPGDGDGEPPHLYARTDLFSFDPDYALETMDTVSEPIEVVQKLLLQYVIPGTHIAIDPADVESGGLAGQFLSMKFRGEESVRTILKELAMRCRHASWGVDEQGQFFFLQKRTDLLGSYREGEALLRLEETRDRDTLVNRVLLTGDYVYFQEESTGGRYRGFYRWRGNYVQPASKAEYGERRLKMWVPWIRTSQDSRQFVREFFRVYSQPVSQYLVEVREPNVLPRPWLGVVQIEARDGTVLVSGTPETIRVQFDHSPVLQMVIGAEDPRTHWPEPPHDERWEVARVDVFERITDILTFTEQTEGGRTSEPTSTEGPTSSDTSTDEPTSDFTSTENSESGPPSRETSTDENTEPPSDSEPLTETEGNSSGGESGSDGRTGNTEGGGGSEGSSEDSSSGGMVRVACCDIPLPTTVQAEFNGVSCADWDGLSLPLIYDEACQCWFTTHTVAGVEMVITLRCQTSPVGWLFSIEGGDCDYAASAEAGENCAPLNLMFSNDLAGEGCCGTLGARLNVTVTE